MSVDRWDPLIAAAAAKWSRSFRVSVPPALVKAIVWQESRGNPLAVRTERDGELSRGLMQVKHSTALELGVRDPRELYQAPVAIDAGTHYLAKQLRRYGGRIPHAAAAYNAGTAFFTERETFRNQSYVDGVLEAFQRFSGRGAPAWLALAGFALGALVLRTRRGRAA